MRTKVSLAAPLTEYTIIQHPNAPPQSRQVQSEAVLVSNQIPSGVEAGQKFTQGYSKDQNGQKHSTFGVWKTIGFVE